MNVEREREAKSLAQKSDGRARVLQSGEHDTTVLQSGKDINGDPVERTISNDEGENVGEGKSEWRLRYEKMVEMIGANGEGRKKQMERNEEEKIDRYGEEGGKKIELRGKRNNQRVFDQLITIFVDGIPGMIDAPWLKSMFKEFGPVMDVFIPDKRRKNTDTRFGFVRYKYKEEALKAVKEMNGAWRHGNKLRVRMAEFGLNKRAHKGSGEEGRVHRRNEVIYNKQWRQCHPNQKSILDHRTYSEVVKKGAKRNNLNAEKKGAEKAGEEEGSKTERDTNSAIVEGYSG